MRRKEEATNEGKHKRREARKVQKANLFCSQDSTGCLFHPESHSSGVEAAPHPPSHCFEIGHVLCHDFTLPVDPRRYSSISFDPPCNALG